MSLTSDVIIVCCIGNRVGGICPSASIANGSFILIDEHGWRCCKLIDGSGWETGAFRCVTSAGDYRTRRFVARRANKILSFRNIVFRITRHEVRFTEFGDPVFISPTPSKRVAQLPQVVCQWGDSGFQRSLGWTERGLRHIAMKSATTSGSTTVFDSALGFV